MHVHFLPRWISAQRLMGGWQHILWDDAPCLLIPEKPSCPCVVGEVSLTSGGIDVVVLSLYSSRAQLTNFVLGVSKENKAPIYSVWRTPAAQPSSPSTSYLIWMSHWNCQPLDTCLTYEHCKGAISTYWWKGTSFSLSWFFHLTKEPRVTQLSIPGL